MSYKQKIIFYTVGFPITCGFTIVLLFYDYLFCLESRCFKYFHNFKAHWYDMPFLPCIAHKYSTELSLFKDTIAFGCNALHFFKKVPNPKIGQVVGNIHIFAIMNNVCIRWMSTNKIYTHVRNKIKISCITLMNKYFTIGAFVLKVGLFPGTYLKQHHLHQHQ